MRCNFLGFDLLLNVQLVLVSLRIIITSSQSNQSADTAGGNLRDPNANKDDFNPLANFDIIKCNCQAEEILVNGIDCQALVTNVNTVDFMSFEPYKVYTIPITQLRSVSQSSSNFSKNCTSTGRQHLKFTDIFFATHWETFNIELYHPMSGHWFDSYCVEHVKNPSGIYLEASVCVKRDVIDVPSCCSSGFILGEDNTCLQEQQITHFQPPIYIGHNLVEDAEIKSITQNKSDCILRALYLSDDSLESLHEGEILEYDMLINETVEHNTTLELFEVETLENETVQSSKSEYNIIGDQKRTPEESQPAPEWAFLVYTDRNVILETHDVFSSDNFCVGLSTASGHLKYKILEWRSDPIQHIHCITNGRNIQPTAIIESRCDVIMYWVVLPLLILSSLFLITILVLYVMQLTEMRKTLGSKMIMCHMVSLLGGFITLIVLHFPQNANCSVYGPVVQLCFLCAFFWLNIMCFDMWLKLRCIRPSHQRETNTTTNRIVVYSIYAWGCPLAITVATIVMDHVIDPLNPNGWIVPGWGINNCWFVDKPAALLYYFGPIAVLMALNLFSFLWVFATLVKANVVSGRILKSKTTPSHRKVWIYLKIFFMMGVSWIFEYISFQEGTCEYWVATDVINALRGVILFMIMFGNRDTLKKVNTKLTAVNGRMHSRFTNSVNNLRKMSIISNTAVFNLSHSNETVRPPSSRRTSEIGAELANKINGHKMGKKRSMTENLNRISPV